MKPEEKQILPDWIFVKASEKKELIKERIRKTRQSLDFLEDFPFFFFIATASP